MSWKTDLLVTPVLAEVQPVQVLRNNQSWALICLLLAHECVKLWKVGAVVRTCRTLPDIAGQPQTIDKPL